MTRINAGVPVEELCDQHLRAEWRELPRIRHDAKRNVDKKHRIPPTFRLNKGHMLFFADKGLYLARRHVRIMKEMQRRGFAPDVGLVLTPFHFPATMRNDWEETAESGALIRERIALRISEGRPAVPTWSEAA